MLNAIWCGMILVSLVYSVLAGTTAETISACFAGTEEGIRLLLSIGGLMGFWSGMLQIARAGGILKAIEKCLIPLTGRLFPGIPAGSEAMNCICANITANLFGLGNAATPFGVAAVKKMQKYAPDAKTASDDMCTFVVLNTASLQLIPSTVIAMRAGLGSSAPAAIIPYCWVTSIAALFAGLFCAAVLRRRRRHG